MHDYNKQPLNIGDCIQNIESGWRGQIQSTDGDGADLLLVCFGINWWTAELDHDDKQWHAPADVVRMNCTPDGSPANAINFM